MPQILVAQPVVGQTVIEHLGECAVDLESRSRLALQIAHPLGEAPGKRLRRQQLQEGPFGIEVGNHPRRPQAFAPGEFHSCGPPSFHQDILHLCPGPHDRALFLRRLAHQAG